MGKLWRVAVILPLILLSTAAFGAVGAIVAIFGMRTAPAQIAIARGWAHAVLWIGGVKLEIEGQEKLHAKGPYVFTANHVSYVDTPVILASIPVQFRFLAKEELFKFPWLFIGWHLKTAGHIPVPRDDPRAAVRTLSHTARLIESDKTSLFFFSEGGRSADGSLSEFKEGAAYIAIKSGAPLVPVALLGLHKILPMGSMEVRPGKVRVRIGEPIPTHGHTLKDRGRLTERAREELAGMLEGMANANKD
jgi:1-acyl-sn-glycerol-3-phosphate acyltransferase